MLALALPVLVGFGALAVDVAYYRLANARLQAAADAGALEAAQELNDQSAAATSGVRFAALNVPAGFGDVTLPQDVVFGACDPAAGSFTPSTESVNAVRVTARRTAARDNAAPRLLSSILGQGPIEIAATAIAARTITATYEAPELFNLAPEAGDYNRVHAYCFDFVGAGPTTARRTQETAIPHNVTPAIAFEWPDCPLGSRSAFASTTSSGESRPRSAGTNPTSASTSATVTPTPS